MVPNAIAPVLVSATIGVATAILTESALSFLGFGVQPPYATWGNILADGKSFIFDAPWLFFIPGMAILVVVLAFNLVGEGLREALNPKLRSR
jgi:peptide/nickel transport system permease protein